MRILVLIHEYPPVGGGGGRVAQDLCQGLAARGHELRLLTAGMTGLPPRETFPNLEIIRLPSLRRQAFKASMPAMAAFVLAALRRGRSEIRRWRPDVIHAHFAVPAGPAARWLARRAHIPYVLTAHLGDVPGGVPEKTGRWFRFIQPLTPPIWRDAAAVAAVSGFTRELALRHYRVPIQVIPNGVDLQDLDPGRIEVHKPPRIVFAGRFVPQKDPLTLVRALAGLQDLPWHCAMLGDGPLRAQVEALIREHGLEARFELPGWVSPEQVIAEFGQSDLLFMPSLAEGLPVVGVQALAMGLAVAATQIGGWADVVEPGANGFLATPGDLPAMQTGLRGLLGDPARLLAARQASRRLAERFDLGAVVAEYEQLFRQVTAQ